MAKSTLSPHRLTEWLIDSYPSPVAAGSLVGSQASPEFTRQGTDVEGKLGIDNGELRISCPRRPGWGRLGIGYGPLAEAPALTFVACILNGHNASRTDKYGQHKHREIVRRIISRGRGMVRDQITGLAKTWAPHSPLARNHGKPHHFYWPTIRENLAMGWFPSPVPSRRPDDFPAFIMQSADHDCGTLCVTSHGQLLPVLNRVQNIPLVLAITQDEKYILYFAATLPNCHDLPSWPTLRPLALVRRHAPWQPFPGITQSVLGEIGFSVDTRVAWTSVLSQELGVQTLALESDPLAGMGSLSEAGRAGTPAWQVTDGAFFRSPAGAEGQKNYNRASFSLAKTAGILSVLTVSKDENARFGLWWRDEAGKRVTVEIAGSGATVQDESQPSVAFIHDTRLRTVREKTQQLSIQFQHPRMRVALDGQLLSGASIPFAFESLSQVGIFSSAAVTFSDLIVLGTEVPRPSRLSQLEIAHPPSGRIELADDFAGDTIALDGRPTSQGPWARVLGDGQIEAGEGIAKVLASTQNPNPGRTLFTIPWTNPHYAEIEIEILPPGSARGQGQLTRGGLVLWQDKDNFIIVNEWNDDIFPGSAVSSFFHLQGEEDILQSVWTNVGTRIQRGIWNRLRLVCDGNCYVVHLNDEVVFYRRITDVVPSAQDLKISRVGIAVNWEYGDDTGTRFRNFKVTRNP